MKKYLSLIFLLIGSLVSCNNEISFTETKEIITKGQIVVDIKGAVMFPGIYSVDSDALLIDVINLAGGLLSVADVDNINLVSKVENHQMIVIPKKDVSNNLLNINKATIEELMKLPGIGKTKAENIINYRNRNGKFISIEQLKEVDGITLTIYNDIKTMVTL